MKKPCRTVLALICALALTAGSAYAAEGTWLVPKVREAPAFADTAGSWCQDYVETVYEAGLMNGVSQDAFDPDGTLTEAQRLVIGTRLHALLHGDTVEAAAPGEAWWLPAARYYLAVEKNSTKAPEDFAELAGKVCNRITFAYQILWSTPAEDLPAINEVSKLPDFNDALMEDAGFGETPILDLYQAGILNGVDRWGSFDPQGTLTRGQAATMLARVIDPDLRLRFQLPVFDLCTEVLEVDGTAAALTVDDQTVTMEQLSQELCLALRQAAYDDPENHTLTAAREIAVNEILEDLAVDRLAAQKGVSVTEEELAAGTVSISNGYEGMNPEGWRWEARHELLHQKLYDLYASDCETPAGTAGSPENCLSAESRFLTALEAAKPAREEVVLSPALEELDLYAAQQRLLHSPFVYV